MQRPTDRPSCPNFGSGPCAKRPGYSLRNLEISHGRVLGRSHRSELGKRFIRRAITETKRLLCVPDDYLVGFVPGSDTGAVEMALWNLLSPDRPVDVLHWDAFGTSWYNDIVRELKLKNVRSFGVEQYGQLPNFSQANWEFHDVVFTLNGTTSGVRVPYNVLFNAPYFAPTKRQGLVICDATSGVFAMEMPWKKLDVVTFSWQKVVGGEAAHGVLILSPRAVERLERIEPPWPIPKLFRLTKKLKNGQVKLMEDIFEGNVINTPSMLCVVDYLDALRWVDSIGGVAGCIERTKKNFEQVRSVVEDSSSGEGVTWIQFLATVPEERSPTSVCLRLINEKTSLPLQKEDVVRIVNLLADQRVAFDIGSYKDAPTGIRIWCGATMEVRDIALLMRWLRWAYDEVLTNTKSKSHL